MESASGEESESLTAAYDKRTKQLREARAALAEAVSALRIELEQRRNEANELRQHANNLSADNHKLRDEIERRSERMAALEEELKSAHNVIDVLYNMKVVRWTVWPRRIVYRLRDRHR